MFDSFTVSGSSLKLLKVGERGVIARVRGTNPTIAEQLKRLGLSPGTSITLEQRFPRFVVRTRRGPLALTQSMIQSIYVRIGGF
ncbi:MAG: ferrous iron transport protein A [Cyanobacteria bacterium P01_H01_bin.21]